MKAADLRKFILQAAVQGKLVPQNPHDEPAGKLLERIRREKAQLVKEGKIKKEKPLPPISEEEIPFDLPEGWVWCRLGEIVTLYNGRAYKKHELLKYGKTPVLRVGNLFTNKEWYYSDLKLTDDKYCEKGDLLYAWSASFGPHIWQGEKCIYHYHIWKLKLNLQLMRDYVYFALLAQTDAIKCSGHGLAMVHVTKENTEKNVFPLPPLAEQHRIVTKVVELLGLCDELEAAEKELNILESDFTEYLPKSILQAAVQGKLVPQNIHDEPADKLLEHIRAEKAKLVKSGKLKKEKPLHPITEDEIPYDLPDGWVWCRLGDVCQVNPRNKLTDEMHVSFVPMTLISSDFFGGHQQEQRVWRDVKSGFTHFAEGDIVIAKITPCFQNKKSCIMRGLKNGFGAGTTELHVLRPIHVLTEYILLYAKSPEFLDDGVKNMTGTAGQQRVPTEFVRSAIIPLPPLAEQQRIVAKVNELMTLCDALKASYETPVGAPIAATVIPFLHQEEEEESEMLIAARGSMPKAPSKALQDARNKLFED